MTKVFLNILNLFDFILIFLLIIVLLTIIFALIFKKFKLSSFKIKLYGLFTCLDNFSIVLLATIIIQQIFIIFCLFDYKDIGTIHLFMLAILGLIYGILSLKISTLIISMFNSVLLYFSIVGSSLLLNYLIDIRFRVYVFALLLLAIVFTILYSLYFTFKNIEDVVKKNKYIRRKE